MRGDWGEKFRSLRYCTGPAVRLPIGWVPGEEDGVQGRGGVYRNELIGERPEQNDSEEELKRAGDGAAG